MGGASIYCQSRGGVVVLLVTGGVFLLPRLRSLRGRAVVSVLVVGLLVLGFLSWCGFAWSKSRLQSVWDGTILDGANNGRSIIWWRVLPLLEQFPVWGTGYGTFPYVEQPFQTRGEYHVVDWAHNEYLQALIEGGIAALALLTLAIFLVFRSGLKAMRRRRASRGLYVGVLFALATFFIHCAFDFPLHLPAITVLVVALSASLVAASGPSPPRRGDFGGQRPAGGPALRMPARALGFAAASVLAFVLVAKGHEAYQAQKLLLASAGAASEGSAVSPADRVAYLRQAAALRPDSSRLQVLLGDAYLESYLEGCHLAGPGPTSGPAPGRQQLEQGYLVPALRHYLLARDLCPLVAKPHVRIAANHHLLVRADPRGVYLSRACHLVPYDAELWYLRGIQEMADQQKAEACRSWRRSLEISNHHLPAILERSRRSFTAESL